MVLSIGVFFFLSEIGRYLEYGFTVLVTLTSFLSIIWIIFLVHAAKKSYHIWKQWPLHYNAQTYSRDNYKVKLVKNVLLIIFLFLDVMTSLVLVLIKLDFIFESKHVYHLTPSCNVTHRSFINAYKRGIYSWALDGIRQMLTFTEISLIYLVLAYLYYVHTVKRTNVSFLKYRIVCIVIVALLIFALNSFPQGYLFGYFAFYFATQIIYVITARYCVLFYRLMKRKVDDLGFEVSVNSYRYKKEVRILKHFKITMLPIAITFQPLLLGQIVDLVEQLISNILKNPCWFNYSYHLNIPQIEYSKQALELVTILSWCFRTLTAGIFLLTVLVTNICMALYYAISRYMMYKNGRYRYSAFSDTTNPLIRAWE